MGIRGGGRVCGKNGQGGVIKRFKMTKGILYIAYGAAAQQEVVGTRVHHAIVNPALTEAQAIVTYFPMWLCVLGLVAAGFAVLTFFR